MLGAIANAIVTLKIVTLIIILIFCLAGVHLLINSGKNPAAMYTGYACFILSGFFASLLFVYSFIREHYEGSLKSQREHFKSLLKEYSNALHELSESRSLVEELHRKDLRSTQTEATQISDKAYSPDQISTTPNR